MEFVLLTVYLLIALVFSFVCSISEAVLLSVRRTYLETLRQTKPGSAKTWEKLTGDINRPLSAILILNTVAHTVGAAGVGAQAAKIYGDAPLTTGVISGVLTLLILILSEIIPKTLGAVFWKGLAPMIGAMLAALTWIMGPLIWMTNLITSSISKGQKKGAFSRAEFIAMTDIGEKEGSIEKNEGRIVKNLFGLRNSVAKYAATPRTVVFSLSESSTVAEYLEKNTDSPFSRIPIYKDSVDEVSGFVLRVELLKAFAQGQEDLSLADLRRQLVAVQDSKNLSDLFNEMIAERIHIMMTVDEFGTFSGVITLEDVIETILGTEIVDEVDNTEDMQQLARDLWKKRAQKMGISTEEDNDTDS